jgi:recombination protein RecT
MEKQMSEITRASPQKVLSQHMEKFKAQIALALPKHLNADRMTRLALTAFSQNKSLQNCDIMSICASVVVAAQLGLEIGVGGQGYLVPYKGKATFVPGWKGLVDLVSRAGRATVWTGAVYEGDVFEYALGDNPFVKHLPEGDSDDPEKITHVYAIGRVNGSNYPVIEVWTMARVKRHLAKHNKVGAQHYAHTNMEMYARKVALLQVLKYMPSSIEVMRAMDVANAVDSGKNFTFDGDIVVVDEDEQSTEKPRTELPALSDEDFNKRKETWQFLIETGEKTNADLIAMISSKSKLNEDQVAVINGFTYKSKESANANA